MISEPIHRPSPRGSNPSNPYEGRWRWWYSAIADWLLRNPSGTQEDCATFLNKSPNTISYIMRSDTFRDYFARRKMEWQESHDHAIRSKLTAVSEKSLDTLLAILDKRGDQIPLNIATQVAMGTLDRLGFGPKTPPSVLIQQNNDNRNVVLPPSVTASALEEARQALRLAEQKKLVPPEPASETSVVEGDFEEIGVGGGEVEAGIPIEGERERERERGEP